MLVDSESATTICASIMEARRRKLISSRVNHHETCALESDVPVADTIRFSDELMGKREE